MRATNPPHNNSLSSHLPVVEENGDSCRQKAMDREARYPPNQTTIAQSVTDILRMVAMVNSRQLLTALQNLEDCHLDRHDK